MNEQYKRIPDNPLAFLIRNSLIKVTPGNKGQDCLAYKSGTACACDECKYYRICMMNTTSDEKNIT